MHEFLDNVVKESHSLDFPGKHASQDRGTPGGIVLISPHDFMNPRQVGGNLGVNSILLHGAALVVRKDSSRINPVFLRVQDSQGTAGVPETHVALILSWACAKHVVVHLRRVGFALITRLALLSGDYTQFKELEDVGLG